jgi:hypothetical protein
MSLKVVSIIFAISIIYFTIIFSSSSSSSSYSNNNFLFSVEAQQPSTISDHEFHGYLEQMKGHLDAIIVY